MRKQFGHLLSLSDSEIDEIWKEATLTVDANVLLDLYRYHRELRETLLRGLREFSGRLWLSHQVGSEFIKNRKRVADAVGDEFDKAESDLKALEAACKKATEDLGNRRPLPDEVRERLRADLEAAIRKARASNKEVRAGHGDGAPVDAVLNEVLALFDGCVGDRPTEEKLAELHREAERRVKDKVPPGYKDAKKDGTGSHGDYLMWDEILQQAKKSAKPMVFVTSEAKEDWWEVVHGKKIGPRPELLEEAHRVTAQRVLIYRTEQFVELATKRAGGTFTASMRADLRASREDQDLEDFITSAAEELGNELIDLDSSVNNLIAETNASGWAIDWVEVTDSGPVDLTTCSAPFTAVLHYSGEQDGDHSWNGTEIRADLRGTMTFVDGSWVITEHQVTNVEIEQDDSESDDDYSVETKPTAPRNTTP
jgi:hypothetical protein